MDALSKLSDIERRRLAARVLFEGPGVATLSEIAAQIGVSVDTARKWSREGGWMRPGERLPDLTGAAVAAADAVAARVEGDGVVASAQAHEFARDVANVQARDLRQAIVERHRKEWEVPRGIAMKAAKTLAGNGGVGGDIVKATDEVADGEVDG